ncbi:hypothetical protein ABE073_00500 [Lederbergia citrisecunda]|uniref:hypothetical protein n=1 Tax=Lederbergia citrisecunda TaxID=2833583 RepID=UPI003D2982C8
MSIFNGRIVGSIWFPFIAIFLLAISYPTYSWNMIIFWLLLGITLYILGFTINFLFARTQRELLSSLFFFVWIRMLLFLFGTIAMLNGLVNIVNYNHKIVIIFIWLIPIICLAGILEFLFIMILRIRNLEESGSRINRFFAIIMAFFALISALILPDFAFGYGYKVFFDVLFPNEITFNWHYLSFVISNTLPVENINLANYIEKINTYPALRIYQIFHVYMIKIMELLIIALILNSLISNILYTRNRNI